MGKRSIGKSEVKYSKLWDPNYCIVPRVYGEDVTSEMKIAATYPDNTVRYDPDPNGFVWVGRCCCVCKRIRGCFYTESEALSAYTRKIQLFLDFVDSFGSSSPPVKKRNLLAFWNGAYHGCLWLKAKRLGTLRKDCCRRTDYFLRFASLERSRSNRCSWRKGFYMAVLHYDK
jgi:hypothetical protein